ncbi:MAG: dihydroorotase [Clostridiales bacterium]|nr:dihydroorotase [Clostridiales bacterium]
MKTLLYNALIVNEGESFNGFLVIDGENIATVGHGDAPGTETFDDNVVAVDCKGDMLLPGAIDSHVHFRDPGLTVKGDIESESRAAIAGGVTSYFDMPNTKPVTTTIEAWNEKMERAAKASVANYAFFLGATNDNLNTLLEADYNRIPGIKLFMGSSTGNMLVDSQGTLDNLFAQAPALIMVHAEDELTINEAKEKLKATYGDSPIPVELHSVMRPREACLKSTRHAIELAKRHDARLHVAHISTADELTLFSPVGLDGKKITAETCPHYLIYSNEDMKALGSRIKCNPAIKEPADRDSLLQAVENGVIDTIATDHAPHTLSDKEGDLFHAASGMPGVQFSLPLMLSIGLDPALVAKLMSHNVAKIFGIEKRGFLREGYKADIVRVNKLLIPHTISDTDVLSRCGWTPYRGLKSSYSIDSVWVNGCLAVKEGKLTGRSNAQPLTFKQSKQ